MDAHLPERASRWALPRTTTVLGLLVLAEVWLWRAGQGDRALLIGDTPSGLDQLLAAIAGLVLQLCVTWLLLVVLLLVVEGVSGRRWGARVAPRHVRRALAVACGIGVLAGVAGPAIAHDSGRGSPTGAAPLTGLALPDRLATGPATVRAVASAPPRRHVVRPGDCLWAIADARLAGASPARIASYADAIYRTNARVIGDDPDLIHPAQTLRLPTPTQKEYR